MISKEKLIEILKTTTVSEVPALIADYGECIFDLLWATWHEIN